MSRYDWEEGKFQLSVVMYRQFRDAIIRAWNVRQEHNYKVALEFHTQLAAAIKIARRGADVHTIAEELLDKKESAYSRLWGMTQKPVFNFRDLYVEPGDFLTKTEKGYKLGPVPKKKDYPLANGATTSFGLDDCSITLSAKERTLTWGVSENNHAVDRARSTFLWQALIGLLKDTTWTRGTGGVISGNDEYNRDSREYGDASNYVNYPH